MSYCNQGDKPKVNYSFGDGSKGEFLANTSPIDVLTSTEPGVEAGYTYQDPNLPGQRTVAGNSYTTEFLEICQKGQTAIRIFKNGFEVLYSCYLPGSLLTVAAIPEKCVLKVNNSANVNLFTIKGKCPVNFTVACIDCPDGQCKCVSTNYPGYCCLPCSQVALEIASITAIARSKK